jgi:hypothetical protein
MTDLQPMKSAFSLTPEDLAALSRSASDLSDFDPRALATAEAGLRYAYRVARRVSEGTLDPLSAP